MGELIPIPENKPIALLKPGETKYFLAVLSEHDDIKPQYFLASSWQDAQTFAKVIISRTNLQYVEISAVTRGLKASYEIAREKYWQDKNGKFWCEENKYTAETLELLMEMDSE
jgi:hypothetical protein